MAAKKLSISRWFGRLTLLFQTSRCHIFITLYCEGQCIAYWTVVVIHPMRWTSLEIRLLWGYTK